MTTCKECKQLIDLDLTVDWSHILCYSAKSPHWCNHYKREMTEREATEIPYRQTCEGFEWKEIVVDEPEKEEPKTYIDWRRIAVLSVSLADRDAEMKFCEDYMDKEVTVTVRASGSNTVVTAIGQGPDTRKMLMDWHKQFLESSLNLRKELDELLGVNDD